MGDPIRYKGKQVGCYYCMNLGKSNQGYAVKFESLEDMTMVLSLPDEAILDFGTDCDTITAKGFKRKFIIDNGILLFSSYTMQERYASRLITEEGKAILENVLQKADL